MNHREHREHRGGRGAGAPRRNEEGLTTKSTEDSKTRSRGGNSRKERQGTQRGGWRPVESEEWIVERALLAVTDQDTDHDTQQDKSLIVKEKSQITPQATQQDTDHVEQLVVVLTGVQGKGVSS